MVNSCVAFGYRSGNKQRFSFPKDIKNWNIWIGALNRNKKDLEKLKTMRLCIDHFYNDQFTVNPSIYRLFL